MERADIVNVDVRATTRSRHGTCPSNGSLHAGCLTGLAYECKSLGHQTHHSDLHSGSDELGSLKKQNHNAVK